MRKILKRIAVLLLCGSAPAFGQNDPSVCASKDSIQFVTINGIGVDIDGADSMKLEFERVVRSYAESVDPSLDARMSFTHFYNQTDGFIDDLFESGVLGLQDDQFSNPELIKKSLFAASSFLDFEARLGRIYDVNRFEDELRKFYLRMQETDFDIQSFTDKYMEELLQYVRDDKCVILNPHSEGNWFANRLLEKAERLGVEPGQIVIFGFATPAGYVASKNQKPYRYVTFPADAIGYVPDNLPPTDIEVSGSCGKRFARILVGSFCHGFKWYLTIPESRDYSMREIFAMMGYQFTLAERVTGFSKDDVLVSGVQQWKGRTYISAGVGADPDYGIFRARETLFRGRPKNPDKHVSSSRSIQDLTSGDRLFFSKNDGVPSSLVTASLGFHFEDTLSLKGDRETVTSVPLGYEVDSIRNAVDAVIFEMKTPIGNAVYVAEGTGPAIGTREYVLRLIGNPENPTRIASVEEVLSDGSDVFLYGENLNGDFSYYVADVDLTEVEFLMSEATYGAWLGRPAVIGNSLYYVVSEASPPRLPSIAVWKVSRSSVPERVGTLFASVGIDRLTQLVGATSKRLYFRTNDLVRDPSGLATRSLNPQVWAFDITQQKVHHFSEVKDRGTRSFRDPVFAFTGDGVYINWPQNDEGAQIFWIGDEDTVSDELYQVPGVTSGHSDIRISRLFGETFYWEDGNRLWRARRGLRQEVNVPGVTSIDRLYGDGSTPYFTAESPEDGKEVWTVVN